LAEHTLIKSNLKIAISTEIVDGFSNFLLIWNVETFMQVGAKGFRFCVARFCVINFVSLIKYKWDLEAQNGSKNLISRKLVDGFSIFLLIWH